MSDDIRKRLDLIEMALGIEPSDVRACPKTPDSECGDCGPEHCPLINNLLQITATHAEDLGRRVRRIEFWLEYLDGSEYPRQIAGLRVEQEELQENIGDVETSVLQTGRAPQRLLSFLAQQRAKLELVEERIRRLQDERQ
jgi:hypothetical protein